MQNNSNGTYETKNTSLAAFLYMQGYPLLDVVATGFPTIFIFESSITLLNDVREFQVSRAVGNLAQFYEAYRKCLKMTKIGKL